jgi:3-oxoacyl-[acyl-carrier protein] reductase
LDLELKGKVALVTGSSRGIGLAIAKTLLDEGCYVLLNGRDSDRLAEVSQELDVPSMQSDVITEVGAKDLVDFVLARYGALDILVCNVGSGKSMNAGQEDWDEWERMLGMNLRSTVNSINAARSALINSRGVALCISSICGSAALGAPLAYSAAKAALNSYVRGINRVLSPQGVRINGLAPGNVLFDGSSWEGRLRDQPQIVHEMLQRDVAQQRLGNPQEIANVAAFLCSSKSSFVSGEVIVVDGGQLRS